MGLWKRNEGFGIVTSQQIKLHREKKIRAARFYAAKEKIVAFVKHRDRGEQVTEI